MIKIGVIADDFTGATDIASFLVENGLPTVQINGVPTGKMPEAIDALVISLKTRSCPVVEATQQSLADAPRDKRTYFREINYIAAAFQYQKKNYNSA